MDDFKQKILDNPLSFIQLICGVIFFISSLLCLFLVAIDFQGDLKSVILIMGGALITIAVTASKNAVPVTMMVLIMGVLVAPRDYLLRIAHMISGSDAAFEDYAKVYPGENRDEFDVADLSQQLTKQLQSKGLSIGKKEQAAISQVLTGHQTSLLANDVREVGAREPLRQVSMGSESFRRWSRDYLDNEFFLEDMEFLRNEELIVFSGSDVASATITKLGQRVLSSFDIAGGASAQLLSAENEPRPQESSILKLNLGDKVVAEHSSNSSQVWRYFEIEENKRVELNVAVEGFGDSKVWLLGPNNIEQTIASNDDSGNGLNSQITRELEPGKYYIKIIDLNSHRPSVTIELLDRSK